MAFARGSQRGIFYVEETTWGVTPGTPAMKTVRTVSDSLVLSKETNQSAELRADRQITDFRHGNKQAGGDIGIELSYEAFDDFLESALLADATWAIAYNVTSQTIDVVAAAKTFTRAAGSYIDDGVLVGDPITFSGFTNPGNNGTFIVTSVTATVVTCDGATGLSDESGDADEAFTTTRETIQVGTTLKSFTIEKAFADITQYQVFTGMVVNTLSLNVAPNAMVTGTLGLVGKDVSISGTPLDASPDAAPTGSPFDSYTGEIREGGAVVAVITSIDLALDNGYEPIFVLMDDSAADVIDKRSNVTGTVNLYFTDTTVLNKFINETESSIWLTLTDLDGDSYRFRIPRVKYGGGDLPVNAEGPIMLTMPFQALYDADTGSNFFIDKIPA
jgi:hypothetical protein